MTEKVYRNKPPYRHFYIKRFLKVNFCFAGESNISKRIKTVEDFTELNNLMGSKIRGVKEMMVFYSDLSYGAWRMLSRQRSALLGLCRKAAL